MNIVMEKEMALKELGEFYQELYQGDELVLDNFVGNPRVVVNSILNGLMKGYITIMQNEDGDKYFKIKLSKKYNYGSEQNIEEIDMFEPKAKDLNSITLENNKVTPFRTSNDIIKKCVLPIKYQSFIDILQVRDTHYLDGVSVFLTGGLKNNIPS
ncbi:hypothetical protein [Brachyspira hyodysenteriae]|uniref:hypothetical protein n=1 Tax=Brachyspira hyodysenteriae TaxID=159 RepID=UPI00063DB503|nr:hypothetical protein [Brachyspira hyodysenteriae]KLI46157.1 hypothetical protein SZ41_12375 [Brachyspira hyodysenteriae]KLI53602.1 hypothetical protein SZ42_00490 [Brachyspira hyodysenteriae]MCZ9889017.1 hypothetical protein [Brachyspira hyodysenteriae]